MATQHCIPMLKALADETRWRIIHELLGSPATVNELTARLGASQYNVSKHLRVLCEAGLLAKETQGQRRLYALVPEFARHLVENKNVLDLGCCQFDFTKMPK